MKRTTRMPRAPQTPSRRRNEPSSAHEKIIHESKRQEAKLRIIPLGGLEEVGENMTVIEYEKNIIIIDMGFRFADEDLLGVDFLIPNIEYLKDKKDWIRGIFITHAHYDHIGAIPYLIDKLGYPPIYTTMLSKGIILKRQEDFPRMKKLRIEIINKNDFKTIQAGPFKVDAFHINHNIPDSIGLAIQTPVGQIIHTCDFKFDFQPVADKPANLARIVELANRGTLLLMSDSTGAENPGYSLSEQTVMENLDEIFDNAKGRIIVSTFASLIGRIQQAIWLAEKHGRRVAIDGYSMRSNVSIATELKYIQAQKHTLIKPEEAIKLPDNTVVIMCTGAQGEDRASLMRIVNKEHRFFRIKPGDSMILSSSIVPGNERAVQYLKDSLYRQGAEVFHYKMMDIHGSGHAYQEELKLMLNLVRPKFFMPIHGQYSMLKSHAHIAQTLDIPKENIAVASNGNIIEITQSSISISTQRAPSTSMMVNSLGTDSVSEVVLKDRQAMAQDGMMIVLALVKSGKVLFEPDIISRGFVYMKESKDLISEIRRRTRHVIERYESRPRHAQTDRDQNNDGALKNILKEELGRFLSAKLRRRPMVIPVIKRV